MNQSSSGMSRTGDAARAAELEETVSGLRKSVAQLEETRASLEATDAREDWSEHKARERIKGVSQDTKPAYELPTSYCRARATGNGSNCLIPSLLMAALGSTESAPSYSLFFFLFPKGEASDVPCPDPNPLPRPSSLTLPRPSSHGTPHQTTLSCA